MIESYLERRVVAWARARGIVTFKIDPTFYPGAPDRIFMVPGGKPTMLEFKTKRGRVSKVQERVFKLLLSQGYNVAVVDDYREAVAYLEKRIRDSRLP